MRKQGTGLECSSSRCLQNFSCKLQMKILSMLDRKGTQRTLETCGLDNILYLQG